MHHTTVNVTIWAIVAIIITVFFLAFLENHDARVMEAGDAYTLCVRAQYGMTPQGYLAENGVYPECK